MQDDGDSSTNAPSPLQFAVLHHSGIDTPHFDLLFEMSPGSPLTTFRFMHWPPNDGDEIVRLRDHRRFYLTYEGPVPGDRGRVDRISDGAAIVRIHPESISLDLSSPAATLHLRRADRDENWAVFLR